MYDLQVECAVALKTLRRLDPTSLYKFRRNSALSPISGTGIITFHELLAEADQWFFTMELVRGCTILSTCERAGLRPNH